MARKKFSMDEVKDTHGPMNSVSKDDAISWVGAPEVKHISQLDPKTKREVMAKKLKAVKSSKKADRRAGKQIIKNIDKKE